MPRIAAASHACKNVLEITLQPLESAMNEPPFSLTTPPSAGRQEGRLDSWKKIAGYLKRDVSTVQRWERREAMPVHRHLHDKLGSVYAFRSELDAWWGSRSAQLAREADRAADAAAASDPDAPLAADRDVAAIPTETRTHARRRRLLWLAAAAAVISIGSVGLWLTERTEYFWKSPLANAQFRSLADFDGTKNAATISRDGTKIAFLADRGGQMDVWLTQVGSVDFRNLTQGSLRDLVNPSIRTLGFSPDATLVSIWTRQADGSRPDDITLQAAPTTGGSLRPYLARAAEFDWSHDGRLVYHTTAPGDPMFVQERDQGVTRQLYVAPSGVHCHFPVWSPDDLFIYFVRGVPPDEWDIWRVRANEGTPEQITFLNARVTHPVFLDRRTLLYLATDHDGSGPWLYSMDIERRTPHRLTSGIERYTSLAASDGAARLVVTVTAKKSALWRIPISEQALTESSASRIALPSSHATLPRLGRDTLLYVSSDGGHEGLWRLVRGAASEIWSNAHARISGAPAIAPDGRIAFVSDTEGRTRLHVMHIDGTDPKIISETLELRGSPAWSPDGQSIACAVSQGGVPRLFRFFPNGDSPMLLVSEYSIDPAWSPDGQFLVYSGPDVGTTFPLRAAAADGRVHPLHSLILTRGARHVRFLRGPHALVILRGEIGNKNLWLVDLDTGSERPLTRLSRNFVIGDFDISSDGQEIVFDQVQENSDLVLIDRVRL
jgi:Tol biopolymer transport system component